MWGGLLLPGLALALSACGADRPTYHADVAPLVTRSCMPCHAGNADNRISLATFRDVRANAYLARHMVETEQMPPGNIDKSGGCQTFTGPQPVPDDERYLLAEWIAAGMPEGEAAAAAASTSESTPVAMDGAIELALPEPYTPTPTAAHPDDDHRCFLLAMPDDAPAILTAFRVIPTAGELVHHVMLFSLPQEESVMQARDLDDAEAGVGWSCFGTPRVSSAMLVGAWAPGRSTIGLPAGTGLPITRQIVMQIHYNTHAGARPDQTAVQLQLVDRVERELAFIPFAATDFVLPPGQAEISNRHIGALPMGRDLEVFGVFPHMHTLGRALRLTTFDRGGVAAPVCLVETRKWDYAWQEVAIFNEPLRVPGNALLELTCSWGTVGRSETTTWGEETADEMCMVFLLAAAR